MNGLRQATAAGRTAIARERVASDEVDIHGWSAVCAGCASTPTAESARSDDEASDEPFTDLLAEITDLPDSKV